MKTAAELRAELKEAEKREAASREAERKLVPIVMQFAIKPRKRTGATKLYATGYKLYVLEGICTNKEQAKAAGHPDYRTNGGSHDIVYNSNDGEIVCYVGGGTLWIYEDYFDRISRGVDAAADDYADDVAMSLISKFLQEHPEGGDVTSIVEKFREVRGFYKTKD